MHYIWCASETIQVLTSKFFSNPLFPLSIRSCILLLTLFYLPSTEVCSTVAFAPLSKNLACGTFCAPENVSFVWTYSNHWVNAIFRYGVFPHEVHGTTVRYESVEVLADGTLHIGTVKTAHDGNYICTASFSNGTVCGIANHTLMVTRLCK